MESSEEAKAFTRNTSFEPWEKQFSGEIGFTRDINPITDKSLAYNLEALRLGGTNGLLLEVGTKSVFMNGYYKSLSNSITVTLDDAHEFKVICFKLSKPVPLKIRFLREKKDLFDTSVDGWLTIPEEQTERFVLAEPVKTSYIQFENASGQKDEVWF